MKEQFVPYEITQILIEKGFKEQCLAYYQNQTLIINALSNYELDKYKLGIPAPLWQQVIDWLRDTHNIDIWVQPFTSERIDGKLYLPDESYSYFIFKDGHFISDKVDFPKPEEARQAVIEQALTLI
jgi:hypothetical protein